MSDQINIWIIDRKGVITQEPIIVSKAAIQPDYITQDASTFELPDDATTRKMFDTAMCYVGKLGLQPYYLYRQGYMSGQLENVSCCREGAEGMYNIQIMEEHQTIIGIGGAATTKVVDFKAHRIKSSFNAKDLATYLNSVDKYIEKRALLLESAYKE